CKYKDPALRENYVEIGAKKAYDCAMAYIEQNPDDDPVLAEVSLKDQDRPQSASRCSSSLKRDEADRYCWYFPFKSDRFIRSMYVGAQTCKVYATKYALP
ncbi:MAG: hypothetical protein Q8P02_03970, partial [Candidatus Micrarchaeota archaeon]|nr:hypothetical protein [Candidatus Micrarchaeota archaeon]